MQAVEADPSAPPYYSIGEGEKPPASKDDEGLTEKQVLERLDAKLKERAGRKVDVQVRGDANLPAGFIRRLQVELERRRDLIDKKYQRVNEKKS